MEKNFTVIDVTTIHAEIFEISSELSQEEAIATAQPCAASYEEGK